MRAVFVFPIFALLLTPAEGAGNAPKPGPAVAGEADASDAAPVPPKTGVPDPKGPGDPRAGKALPLPRTVDPGTPLKGATSPTSAERLDALFKDLKREASPEKAAEIASEIGSEWGESGSATVDLLMLWAGDAMAKNNSAAAFDMLEQAIILKPDYAEAWNRRATLNYTTSAYGKSLSDIEQTLRLEPRHFGALMGLGMILEETDRKQKALDAYMRVLEIYPAMKGAQDAVARLADELTGQGI